MLPIPVRVLWSWLHHPEESFAVLWSIHTGLAQSRMGWTYYMDELYFWSPDDEDSSGLSLIPLQKEESSRLEKVLEEEGDLLNKALSEDTLPGVIKHGMSVSGKAKSPV